MRYGKIIIRVCNRWIDCAGDANRDGVVNVTDRNLFWRTQNGQPFNYSTSTADFNLDGAVNDTDKNALWKNNNSRLQSLD
jgi:hypothetical protein